MRISGLNSPNFCWNLKTHIAITEEALKDNESVNKTEKRMLGRFSQMPDLMKEELEDLNSAHFYDALHEDPSFGTVNDDKNNAMGKFLFHTEQALKQKDREKFLRETGYAVHYLQDASTPPHTEHGNYLQKLFRLPMHINFERGNYIGASSRLETLKKNYKYEELPFSNLKMLFHNTALYTVQPENQVKYKNIGKWFDIQQRCFNRGVNASRAYLEFILKYLPAKKL